MKLINVLNIKSWKKRISFPLEYLKIKYLINKYYKNYFIIAPASNLGETIITASLMSEFKKKYFAKVVLLTNKKLREITKLFKGVDEILTIYAYYPLKKTNITSISKSKIFPVFEKYINTDFIPKNMIDSHRYLLGLKEDVKPEKIKLNSDFLSNIKNKYGLADNTIFLSPEANSLNYKILYPDFWIKLADLLISNGYDVVINSKNNKFKNYNCIFSSVLDTVAIAENCKCVIGFRSGLMDVFALSVSKKIFAIYPSDNYQIYLFMSNKNIKNNLNKTKAQTVLDYSSLNTMYYNENITETIFDGNIELLINNIKKFINNI